MVSRPGEFERIWYKWILKSIFRYLLLYFFAGVIWVPARADNDYLQKFKSKQETYFKAKIALDMRSLYPYVTVRSFSFFTLGFLKLLKLDFP